jgi:hypothetical protein
MFGPKGNRPCVPTAASLPTQPSEAAGEEKSLLRKSPFQPSDAAGKVPSYGPAPFIICQFYLGPRPSEDIYLRARLIIFLPHEKASTNKNSPIFCFALRKSSEVGFSCSRLNLITVVPFFY